MRLCIDARMIHSSGIGTFLQNLIPFIAKDPFEVILLSKEPHPTQMSIRFTSSIYSLAEQVFYPWKIPPCDIFWSPHYNAPLLPIQAKRRVVTIHDVCHLAQPFPKVKRFIAHFLLQNACKKSDQIVTISSFSRSEIQKYLGAYKEKIQVIYPGVNVEEFSPKKDEEKDPFFLFVGNRKPHKNLATLIQAFEQLSLKNYRLVIVGKKEKLRSSDPIIDELIKRSPLRQQIDLLEEVSQEKLQKLYAAASALIFPSLYEGFGLPPLEAMASGCPVIASNAASIPEACGEAALYFDPLSIQQLKEKMLCIITEGSLRQQLVQNGLKRSAFFSWENAANKYRALFFKLFS